MPEVEIHIGGRVFQVACQEGEERFLQSAASLLDNEAQSLADALGRVPESRMLLMAGLMLADKTAGLEEELRAVERKLAEQSRNAEGRPATPTLTPTLVPSPVAEPEKIEVRVEVPVIPKEVIAAFAQIADRAEGVASQVEDAAVS
jgi:cell division protein ZapA